MILLICVVIAALAYLAHKWMTRNNDYFNSLPSTEFFETRSYWVKDRNLPYTLPRLLAFFKKNSLPDLVLKWYGDFKNEKINGMFQFLTPVFLVRDPQLIKRMTVKDFDYFTDHKVIISEDLDALFGKALISLTGQKWKDMRSTLSPASTGLKMRQMFDFVVAVSRQTTDTLKQQNVLKEVEFKDLAMKFTVDNIASCAFGIEVNSFKDPANSFQAIAKEFSDFGKFKNVLKFAGYLLVPKLMQLLKIKFFDGRIDEFFQDAILNTIRVREEKGIIRHDMINLLIQAKKGKLTHETTDDEKVTDGFATVQESQMRKSTDVRKQWDDEDLAAQCFIFFLAGFDTVATAMSFMAYELAVNTEVQQKLYDEIVETESDLNGRSVTYEKLQRMKYLDQVVCEVLRKWPPAPFTDRICVKDYELDCDGKKIVIEKGMNLFVPIWAIQNDSNYFPHPNKFDPERFSDENKGSIQEYTYIPFGTGPRGCIGSRFALMEIKTIFYYLLMQFQINVTSKTQIPLQLKKVPVGLKTERGVWVELQPR